jgi:hypothetical protein
MEIIQNELSIVTVKHNKDDKEVILNLKENKNEEATNF